MDETLDDDLVVTGAIYAGNIIQGSVTIEPIANTPTSIDITGVSLRGTGRTFAQITANTTVPGLRVREVSAGPSPTESGMVIWLYRTNTYPTIVRWLMWRLP